MLRVDPETQRILDMRFIDLQMTRFAPIYSDLQYFLYMNTNRSFRAAHLDTVLRTYVDAFNVYANVTPDLLTLEKFTKDFEETRLCGALLAICLRPLAFVGDITPPDGQELTEENFLNLSGADSGLQSQRKLQRNAIQIFDENELFRTTMEEFISDLTEQMNKYAFC
jgi:Ecdysteroid kinase-like family